MRNDLPDEVLMPLGEALALLPNVKPRRARKLLVDLRETFESEFVDALRRGEPWAEAHAHEQEVDGEGQPIPFPPDPRRHKVAPGVSVTPAEVDAVFAGAERNRVTPEGAALLVRLYEADAFEPQRRRVGRADPAELRAYAASGPALHEQAARRRAALEEAARAYHERVRHPETIAESEFSYRLLNDVFVARFGLRGGTVSMEIGGVVVTKDVHTYVSNSGRSRDSSVTFSWTASDGAPRELPKDSAYAGNRRNDPDRNWGLGPE